MSWIELDNINITDELVFLNTVADMTSCFVEMFDKEIKNENIFGFSSILCLIICINTKLQS